MKRRKREEPSATFAQAPIYSPGGDVGDQDVAALLTASQAVNSVLGMEEALKVVLSSAKQLCAAHEGSVMMLDDEGFLRILASEGIPMDVASQAKIALGEGVSGKVAETGRPMLISVRPEEREFESFVGRDRPLKSSISVPLRTMSRIVGVLNLNLTDGQRSFTEHDLRLGQIFGEQAAMVLHKATLLEEAQHRSEDLMALLEASKGLIGFLDLEPLMTRVLDGAVRLTAGRAGFICLLDDDAGQLSLGVYQGVARQDIREVLGRSGFTAMFTTEAGRCVPIHEVAGVLGGLGGENEYATMFWARGEGNTRVLLIVIGDKCDQARMRLCHTFITQAGLAIRNSQLYERVGRKETELASIVYSMANPVLVVDPAGRLVIANPAAEELFAFSSEFMKGQRIQGMLGEPKLEELIAGDSTETFDIATGGRTGRIWKARLSKIRTPDTSLGGKILVMDDVTREKEMEKIKGDFVAVIGHELRTPLTLIQGFVKTLLRRGSKMAPEQQLDALRTVETQSQRLSRLIEDLLYVSHIETVRPALHLEQVELVSMISSVMEEISRREPGRSFNFDAPAQVQIVADPTKVEQIVFHLLDNAFKYSPADKPVGVDIQDRGEDVLIKVADKGVGILSEDIPTLFQRFHQIDATSTRTAGGTGVGLFISKSLVDAHGGQIGVESAWGKGSVFWFTIPMGLGSDSGDPASLAAPRDAMVAVVQESS